MDEVMHLRTPIFGWPSNQPSVCNAASLMTIQARDHEMQGVLDGVAHD
jgi:hypothetical protein